MPGLHPEVDPQGLLEYSVVFTDRSLNHMSQSFQQVMRDISAAMREVYGAEAVAVVPGGGTYAMEAVARQFVQRQPVTIVRNGWFSFRWTQIIEMGALTEEVQVLKATQLVDDVQSPFAPAVIDDVVAAIHAQKPSVVFAPHVETSAGMLLPDDYLRQVGQAVREVGGLFVLDCIASGALWVDMPANAVDVLISAPQKGWSGTPCAGLVMMGQRALDRLEQTQSNSFACDLKKWLQIMQAYESGAHAYHATMPTDGLRQFRDAMEETRTFGFAAARDAQIELGTRVRGLLGQRGFKSVAAPGFEAPGVVVSYTEDDGIRSGQKFAAQGMQIAAGVPLQCDERDDFSTFRIGLFGLDKLQHIDRTVASLDDALNGL